MFISLLMSITVMSILYGTTTVDQNKLNNVYFERYKKEHKYIELEKSKAEKNYGIQYANKTIETLKKWHTVNSIEQVRSIKKIFSREKKVSIDTIVLQKMIINNAKKGNYHRLYYNSRPLIACNMLYLKIF